MAYSFISLLLMNCCAILGKMVEWFLLFSSFKELRLPYDLDDGEEIDSIFCVNTHHTTCTTLRNTTHARMYCINNYDKIVIIAGMSIIRQNNKSEIIIIFKNFSLTHICFIITCQVMTNDLAKDMTNDLAKDLIFCCFHGILKKTTCIKKKT